MTNKAVFCLAHPDDEAFLAACLIRRMADEGEPPALLLSTRGDAGHKNGAYMHYSRSELGAKREEEMSRAASVMGLAAVEYLGLPDGKTQEADPDAFLAGVAEFLRRRQPVEVYTFPPDGMNFHPDHVAISAVVTRAVAEGHAPSVQRLYYAMSETLRAEGRQAAVVVDTKPMWALKAEALRAHESQILAVERYFGKLDRFPEERRYEAFALGWERGAFWPTA